LVRKLERRDLVRNTVQAEVSCTYTTFVSDEGDRYFQIGTSGSKTRKGKGNNQVLQFDEQAARQLAELISAEFVGRSATKRDAAWNDPLAPVARLNEDSE
jgi:hypothetical protein